MMRFADPSQPVPDSPLPPVYSRLSTTRLSGGVGDGAPAGPYFGPSGPAPRASKRADAARAAGGDGVRAGRQRTGARVAAPPIMPLLDRTAAHGAPLAPQPDDVVAVTGTAGPDGAVEPGRPGGAPPARPVAAPDRSLADLVADRLERLAAKIRAQGDPRLARATDSGEPLDAVLADIVGDYLRDQGA